MIYCKNKECPVNANSVQPFEGRECDTCWEVKNSAEQLHNNLMEMRDNEPMDGDETEAIAKLFLATLNKLNANN